LSEVKKNNSLYIILVLVIAVGMVITVFTNYSVNEKQTIIEKRLDEQEKVIIDLWVANYNNTVINQNQEQFHADLLDWAKNMTQTIKDIKK